MLQLLCYTCTVVVYTRNTEYHTLSPVPGVSVPCWCTIISYHHHSDRYRITIRISACTTLYTQHMMLLLLYSLFYYCYCCTTVQLCVLLIAVRLQTVLLYHSIYCCACLRGEGGQQIKYRQGTTISYILYLISCVLYSKVLEP